MTIAEALWKLHMSLPRQLPGSDPATRNLLRLAGAKNFKTALDISYDPSCSAPVLAGIGLQVTAVGAQPFLDKIDQTEAAQGSLPITKLPALANGSNIKTTFDLVWAEGSASNLGWERALVEWAKYLAKDGLLVVTDCMWLTQTPTDEVWAYWSLAYPRMLTVPQARYAAEKAGYTVMHTYFVSDNDWFEEYLNPLVQQHELYKNDPDPVMQRAIAFGKSQVYLREKYAKEYGYVGFVLKKI